MAEIGKFFVTIGSKFDSKGFANARQNINQLGKVFASFSVVAGSALLFVTKKASDLEETTSKFNTVFRGTRDEARKFEKDLVQAYGLSTLEARKSLASIQDFLVPMGIARGEATNLSGAFVKMATDLGSFNNLPTAEVMIAIQSGLSGMGMPLKRFGVNLTQTRIEQNLFNKGLIKTKADITTALRAQETYNIILEDSSDSIGDTIRTQGSFANQLRIATNRIEDLTTATGDSFLPIMTELVSIFNKEIIPAMTKWAGEFGKSKEGAEKLIKIISKIVTVLQGFVGLVKIAISAQVALWLALTGHFKAAKLGLDDLQREIMNFADDQKKIADREKQLIDSVGKARDEGNKKVIDSNAEKIAAFAKTEKKITRMTKAEIDKRKSFHMKIADFVKEQAEKQANEETERALKKKEALKENLQSAFDTMIGFFDLQNIRVEDDKVKNIEQENELYNTKRQFIIDNVVDNDERAKQLEALEQEHQTALNRIDDEAQSRKKSINRKKKTGMIGQAIANTALGATKTLAEWGFPLGAVFAALTIAAGALQIATIKAQKFGKGGFVNQATLGVLGERGQEVALPLNSPTTTKALSTALALAGGGSGGGVNISISMNQFSSRAEARKQAEVVGNIMVGKVKRNRRIF
jgi:hypothetical protein